MSSKGDTVIVRHPVHAAVGKEELVPALDPDDRLPTIIDIPAVPIPYGTSHIDWRAAVDAQREQVRRDYDPKVRDLESPRILYAGRAPIPLVMHLGLRLGPWHPVEARQPHHQTRSWAWDAAPHPDFDLNVDGVPERRQATAGDVVVRVSTSFAVDPDHTATVVPHDVAIAEIDITTTPLDRDALHHPEPIKAVADAFRDVLTATRNHLPNATAVHVFAAVPMGLAFQMGARLQANIDLPHVFTYQFNPDGPPFYHRAIDLRQDAGESALLTDEQAESAASVRAVWRDQCVAVAAFSTRLKAERSNSHWLAAFPEDEGARIIGSLPPGWPALPHAGGTDLDRASISEEPLLGGEPYDYAPRDGEWAVADDFLAGVSSALPNEDDQKLAGVLFLFHEGLHRKVHTLTPYTARGIGRFPKAIEAADYQADLWAMVQASELYEDRTVEFLDRAIRVATETMWSFTGVSPTVHVLELRAANRFLNWYWQAVRIREQRDFASALEALATPPTIELAGAQTTLSRGRPALVVSGPVPADLEITLWQGNQVTTLGPTSPAPLRDIVLGFSARNGARIQGALQGVYDTLRRN